MPTPGHGTIGSLDYPPEERRRLAKKSTSFVCDICGPIVALLAPKPTTSATAASSSTSTVDEAKEIVKNYSFKVRDFCRVFSVAIEYEWNYFLFHDGK